MKKKSGEQRSSLTSNQQMDPPPQINNYSKVEGDECGALVAARGTTPVCCGRDVRLLVSE